MFEDGSVYKKNNFVYKLDVIIINFDY